MYAQLWLERSAMGGAVVWADGETREACDSELDERIRQAKRMGLEDVRSRSEPVLMNNGLWVADAWLHT